MKSIAIALLAGIAGALALTQPPGVAQAQDVAPAPVLPSLDVTAYLVPAAIVIAVVLFARVFLAGVLAPTPATHLSKTLCLGLALVTGIVLGLASVAQPVGPGVAGQVAGGVLVAALASFGEGFATSGWKAAKAPAKLS